MATETPEERKKRLNREKQARWRARKAETPEETAERHRIERERAWDLMRKTDADRRQHPKETPEERKRRQNREKVARWRAKKKAEKQLALEIEMQKARAVALRAQRQMTPEKIEEGLEWMSRLSVPDGGRYGEAFDLEDWQKDWVRGVMQEDVQVGGLSISRKNAKSMLNTLLQGCFLSGPWNYYGWVGICCADKGEHAELMRHYLQILSDMNQLGITFRRSPRPGRAYGMEESQLYFLAADKDRTGHASNPDIVWLDEAGALTENQRPLWNALYSSLGSKDGKFLCIGNQRQGPMFRDLELRADMDDMVYFRRYSAPTDCDPLDEKVWKMANPGLGTIKSWNYMRGRARDSKLSAGNLTSFMSFDLNMDVDPVKEAIVSPRMWKKCISADAELGGESVVLGFDMGGSVSMSAAFAIGLESGICRTWAAFSANPGLLERGRKDGVGNTYLLMAERGELRVYPGETVKAAHFIRDVFDELDAADCWVLAIGADRYRRAEFTDALREAGASCQVLWRGQGAGARADGSNDVWAFQRLVLNQGIALRENLGMVNAILNSHLGRDNALNPRLEKNNSAGRIDLLSAAVIAAGLYDMATAGKAAPADQLFASLRKL